MEFEMKKVVSTDRRSQEIVGKTITGVIARPGNNAEIIMLQFDDGTCFELLSSRSRTALRRMAEENHAQLSFFSTDGEPSTANVRPSLAA